MAYATREARKVLAAGTYAARTGEITHGDLNGLR